MTLRHTAAAGVLLVLLAVPSATTAQISIGYPGPYGRGAYDVSSSVRLQVTPKETQVFVDGYYAGTVDEFDGTFQRLRVEPGDHDIQLFLPGHRSYSQKLYLQPGNTFKVRHAMERLAAGEPEPERPVAQPRAQRGPTPQPGQRRQPSPGVRDERDAGPPRSGYGTLSIRVQPDDAQVLIDGEPWSTTAGDDRLLVQLAAGTHTIDVRKAGYRAYLTEVTVRGGETLPLNIGLAREP